MPVSILPHQDEDYINKSLLASLDAQADAEPTSSDDSDHPIATSYGSTSTSSLSGSPSVNYHHQDSSSEHPAFQNMRLYSAANYRHSDYPPPDEYEPVSTNNFRNSFNAFPNTTRSRHQANQSVFSPGSNTFDIFPGQITSPVQSHMQAYDPRASYDYPNGHPANAQQSYHSDQYGVAPHNPGKQLGQYNVQLSSQTPYGPHLPASASMGASTNPPAPPGLSGSASVSMANGANAAPNGEEISTIFVVGFPEDMQEREFQNMFTFSPGFEAATLKIPNKEYTSYGGVLGAAPGPPTLANGGGANGLRGPAFASYVGQNDPYNLVTVNQGGVVVDGGRDGTMASWPASVAPGDDMASTQHYLSAAGINGLVAAAAAGSTAGANLPPRKQIIGFAKFRSREEALVARDVLQGRRVDIDKGAVLKAEMAKKNLHTKRGVGPVPGVSVGPGPGTGPMGTALPNGPSSTVQQQHLNGMLLDAYGNGLGAESTVFSTREHRDSMSMPALARLGWRDSNSQQPDPNLMNGIPSREDEESQRKRDSIVTAIGTMSLSAASSSSPSTLAPGSAPGSSIPGDRSSTSTIRGPRERAEDDDRERRKKEKEKERELNLMRLRARDSVAFDLFHAASPHPIATPNPGAVGMSRQSSNASQSLSGASSTGGTNSSALLTPSSSAENGSGSSPMISGAEQQQPSQHDEIVGPWDKINRAVPVGQARSETERSMSPTPLGGGFQLQQHGAQSESSQTSDVGGTGQGGTNPLGHVGGGLNGNGHANGGQGDAAIRAAAGELVLNNLPHHHLNHIQQQGVVGMGGNGAGTGSGAATASSASNGGTSPTLPSPTSGGSSSSTSTTSASLRGTVDQNPPINTLYVGNLPTSPPPMGYPADYLQETLRDVFSQRPGYRKLCFRHKAAGPMCFVEFEDVQLATKALTDMSGNTLKGIVKNGIRLSYSKNPLGVRTPTSAGGSNSGGPTLQQQQQLMQTLSNHHHAQYQHQSSDSFQTRLADEYGNGGHMQQQQQQHHRAGVPPTSILRRDSTMSPPMQQGLQSFGNGGNNNNNANSFLASPPPRFYATNGMFPSTTPLTGASSAFIPRSAANGVGGPLSGMFSGNNSGAYVGSPSSFSMFGAFHSGNEGPFAHPPPPQNFQQHSIPDEQLQHLSHHDL